MSADNRRAYSPCEELSLYRCPGRDISPEDSDHQCELEYKDTFGPYFKPVYTEVEGSMEHTTDSDFIQFGRPRKVFDGLGDMLEISDAA